MNDYDRENLQFLLNATPDVLEDWYSKVDKDDHEYATELLKLYKEELDIKETLLLKDEVSDITEADTLLKRYMK